MLEIILEADANLLVWIHQQVHPEWLDSWVPLLREKWLWIPVYIFLIGFMAFNFKGRGWIWVALMLVTVGFTDTLSSKVIKKSVQRLRPCHVEEVATNLDLLIPCGGKYSFTSSHAANHFGIAFFFIFTLGAVVRKWRWLALLWAGAICFAQVYVGVHYPLDILGGALLGLLIGGVVAWYFNGRWKLAASDAANQDV